MEYMSIIAFILGTIPWIVTMGFFAIFLLFVCINVINLNRKEYNKEDKD